MSLEDLTQIEVTSVTKHSETLLDAPAAIFVITQDDIRRSGATTIADALRLAPGLEVAKVGAHDWAISSRGFNELYANKLLVLIDGRSVYTPLFSGVNWDVQDTMLEDIDRIEVIRGPGATLWGANAVNGVINITTKSAKQTQGLLVTSGYGTEEQGFGGFRYGGKLGERAYYRAYVKYFDRDSSALPGGGQANDAWDMVRGGFRADWEALGENAFTLQGDVYHGTENQTETLWSPSAPYANAVPDKARVDGANILGRWTHPFSAASELRVQTYYDWEARRFDVFDERRATVDVEAQLRHPLGERQNVTWGVGYRYIANDNARGNFNLAFEPSDEVSRIFNSFVQDEITLIKDRLRLTLGSKLEHNDYTGVEIEPSARLWWRPHEQHSVWAAVSRSVRTPSRAERGSQIVNEVLPPGSPPGFLSVPTVVTVDGSSGFKSEVLLAYELGYRFQPLERLSVDLTGFYNDYDRLRSLEPGPVDASSLPAYIRAPNFFDNLLKGQSYGAELAVNFQATEWWRWRGSYSALQVQLQDKAGGLDRLSGSAEGDTHHQASLRSLMDLPCHFQFDCTGRFVDRVSNLKVPGYVTMDARLAWSPTPHLELALVGQNLLSARHAEFTPSIIKYQTTEVERSVYAKVTLRF